MISNKQRDRLISIISDLILPGERYTGTLFRSKKHSKKVETIHSEFEPREALLSSPSAAHDFISRGEDLKIDASNQAYLETEKKPWKDKKLCPIDFAAVAAIGSLVKGPLSNDDWIMICSIISISEVKINWKFDGQNVVVFSIYDAGSSSLKDPVKTYV